MHKSIPFFMDTEDLLELDDLMRELTEGLNVCWDKQDNSRYQSYSLEIEEKNDYGCIHHTYKITYKDMLLMKKFSDMLVCYPNPGDVDDELYRKDNDNKPFHGCLFETTTPDKTFTNMYDAIDKLSKALYGMIDDSDAWDKD